MSSSQRLKDRVALVTGAGRGIGRATAVALAAEGAHVIVNDIDGASARAVAEELSALGRRAMASAADISDVDAVESLVQSAEDALGPLEILVNNAGITRDTMLHKMSTAQWDAVLAVNLTGPFLLGQAAARRMMQTRRGRIVNVASLAWLGNIGQTNYSAAKAGLVGMTRTWALELGRHGITANAVAPGFIETDMALGRGSPAETQATLDAMAARAMVRRTGLPEDIANAVAFLVSPASGFITAQTLTVDGGRMDYISHP